MKAPSAQDDAMRALDAASITEDGWTDTTKFLGFSSPDDPYLLTFDVVEAVLDGLERAGWKIVRADA